MRKAFFIILVLLFNWTNAQEILTGLSENPAIKRSSERPAALFKASSFDRPAPLLLPFFDDFKQQSIYPDTSRWMDNHVFINNDFALFPPTWNVATFDAIDAYGNIYSNANSVFFKADYLTSKPIRLDSVFSPQPAALSPADSVYLSFYYQPQGLANDPQVQDSLVLEFGYYTGNYVFSRVDSITVPLSLYGVDIVFPGDTLISPCDPNWGFRVMDTLYVNDSVTLPCDSVFMPLTAWQRIWASEGMTLDTFLARNNNQYFRQVMIPVTDSMWFREDFQFRFYNYASIASDNLQSWQSNCDQWNIDFVLLDRGRSRLDTTHKALSFVGSAPSFLSNYQSVPYYQYQNDPTGFMKLGLEMLISNLDNGNQTAKYYYEVRNDLGNLSFSYDGGSGDLQPFNLAGYTTISAFAFPPVAGVFPPFGDRDSIHFDITQYLEGDLQLGLVDTLRFRQKFHNYYAYDDGTPEFGYGLTPTGAQLAYRFVLSRRDTLRAVKMFFNKTFTGANDRFFDLAIWNHDANANRPGELIYVQERERPQFYDDLYQFHMYHLDEPVPVQGTFYVGWIQRSSHNLNVGFDAGNDASSNIFFNVTGEWLSSAYSGALMIRPVLGKPIITEPEVKSADARQFVIVPNPSLDGQVSFRFLNFRDNQPQYVEIEPEQLQHIQMQVFNLMGQKVYDHRYTHQIDLSYLSKGIYILRMHDRNENSTMVQKLVISR